MLSFFLPNVPGAAFIQGATFIQEATFIQGTTFIPDSRVNDLDLTVLPNKL